MNAAALPNPSNNALDALLWSFLDPAGELEPDARPAEKVEQKADATLAARLVELCLQHVLLRDCVEEEASRAAAATRPARVHAGPADAELVLQAEQGVPGAFEILMERYLSMVIGVAYSLLSDAEASRDVAQDTFMEAAQTLTLLREREKFGNWLYGISRRKASYVLRRRKMHQAAINYKQQEEKTLPRQDDPSAPVARQERNENVRRALNQLPEIYREIIVLRYIDGRSYEEIASVLGISLAAVDKRLMRGKAMLKEPLQRWMNE
ncbi:MAG: RNA polymerase sigma factor [Planctomycetes bacterium]|nr:RNA polymerase sigma factor [Planctomycetota bacterium]